MRFFIVLFYVVELGLRCVYIQSFMLYLYHIYISLQQSGLLSKYYTLLKNIQLRYLCIIIY